MIRRSPTLVLTATLVKARRGVLSKYQAEAAATVLTGERMAKSTRAAVTALVSGTAEGATPGVKKALQSNELELAVLLETIRRIEVAGMAPRRLLFSQLRAIDLVLSHKLKWFLATGQGDEKAAEADEEEADGGAGEEGGEEEVEVAEEEGGEEVVEGGEEEKIPEDKVARKKRKHAAHKAQRATDILDAVRLFYTDTYLKKIVGQTFSDKALSGARKEVAEIQTHLETLNPDVYAAIQHFGTESPRPIPPQLPLRRVPASAGRAPVEMDPRTPNRPPGAKRGGGGDQVGRPDG